MTISKSNKILGIYILKFVICFCSLYYGTLALIGLSSPSGKFYSSIIDNYLDYISWLRASLMYASKALLFLFGYHVNLFFPTLEKFDNGMGIMIGYDCLGYGVISFWMAFVLANQCSVKKKLQWLAGGVFTIWCINVLRISVLLIAIFHRWAIPFFDQHTWFNIAAYLLIFIMIYLYDKANKLKFIHNKSVNSTK